MQRGTNLQKGHPREHFTMFYLRYMGIQEGIFAVHQCVPHYKCEYKSCRWELKVIM